MKITKLQQSGFIIESADGFKLGIDIGNKTPIKDLQNIQLDALIVSHIHGDHFCPENINILNPTKLIMPRSCHNTLITLNNTNNVSLTGYINNSIESQQHFSGKNIIITDDSSLNIDNIQIEVFYVDHGPNVSAPVPENYGFLITLDGKKIYFAGDIFYASGIDVTNLEIDYALLPVGTFYTFGPIEAFNFAKKFKSIKTIIPMHYEKAPETCGDFVNLVGDSFNIQIQ